MNHACENDIMAGFLWKLLPYLYKKIIYSSKIYFAGNLPGHSIYPVAGTNIKIIRKWNSI